MRLHDSAFSSRLRPRPAAPRRAALLLGLSLLTAPLPSPAADPAPDVLPQLQALAPRDTTGASFEATSLRGKPAVINFWATWCPPCIREMPDLAALHAELGDAVHFVGVAADAPANIERFVQKHPGIDFTLLPVGYKALSLSKQWGNESNGLPFTVVLDPQGRIQWRHSGQVSIDALRSVLKSAELH